MASKTLVVELIRLCGLAKWSDLRPIAAGLHCVPEII
jgi:hypothetical protein